MLPADSPPSFPRLRRDRDPLPLPHSMSQDTRRAAARAKAGKADTGDEVVPIARNKRARHDYEILDTWEAGIVLGGTEVKSLRDGKANINDAYGIVKDGEVFLLNMHISPYEQASYNAHAPDRTRKLLLHRKEIRRLIGAVERQGLTLVALDLYFRKGKAKVTIALGKGKKLHDKRQTERERDAQRELARIVRAR